MAAMTTKMIPTIAALRGWRSGCIEPPCLQDVERGEQRDPDDVDEVPVERCRLDRVVVPRAELASQAAIQHDRQHHRSAEYVGAVESGEGVERRPEWCVRDAEAKLRVVVHLADQ